MCLGTEMIYSQIYILTKNVQLLNNVIIIKTTVHLPERLVTLVMFTHVLGLWLPNYQERSNYLVFRSFDF